MPSSQDETGTRALRRTATILILLLLGAAGSAPPSATQQAQAADPSERWLPAIERFAQQDAENPPHKGGILFLGSSSIRMWKLDEWFGDLPVLNRGFGGSQISDSLYFLEQLVFPYAPRTLVFYAGDNDIAAGKSAERVAADFRTLVARVHAEQAECRIVFVAIKPSLARWNLVESMRSVNRLVQGFAEGEKLVDFLDVDTPMIGKDGRPLAKLFLADGLHMTREGYAVWSELLRPLLEP